MYYLQVLRRCSKKLLRHYIHFYSLKTVIIFLLEYLDNKVKTVDDIENTIGIPVLGIVSEFESTQNKIGFGKKKKR